MVTFYKEVVFTESRKVNVIVGRSGGTASENSENYKISLPSKWVKQMGITKDNREVELLFDGERITISARREYEAFVNEKKSKKHKLKIFKLFEEDKLLTEICADYTEEKVCIKNYTNDVLKTAFGVNEEPRWSDFSEFLESRCIPRSRSGLREYLDALGLCGYVPEEIIKITQGRMKEDRMYILTEEI